MTEQLTEQQIVELEKLKAEIHRDMAAGARAEYERYVKNGYRIVSSPDEDDDEEFVDDDELDTKDMAKAAAEIENEAIKAKREEEIKMKQIIDSIG